MDSDLPIKPVDQDWDPGTFDFGFEDNIVELIEDLLKEDSLDLSYLAEPTIPSRPVYEPGSPEDTREKRYTPRGGAWCGHEAVLRTWSTATSPKCQHCGNTDRWLWTCIADTPDYSPFSPDTEPIIRDVSILAPWVQKAIVRGEYTDAQVTKLLDQKIKVLELSASERRRVTQEGNKQPAGSSKVLAASLSQAVESQLANDDESTSDKTITPTLPEKTEPATTCRLLACLACKPRFIEQAWGCINAIINEPYLAPPRIPEYLDRPLSNAATLRNMHEHCRHWDWSPEFQLWWETARFVGGYDLLPMLLMAEMIGSNQTHFIDFIGHMVLYRRMTRSQMCQCLYLLSPQACTQLVPFLGDNAWSIPIHPERLAVELGVQPIQEEEESQ
ncbi:hypothetical protein PMG11_06833 [Penicillium brasilianum]|uniref:Uncharacterized protein n=1 Tax=Penicillium brasilianum TaxID=104259 RepID=A0A0F7TQR5_PENBI|nr:hypothetical protein PMG11_06833 [Penicillium brasilianum]